MRKGIPLVGLLSLVQVAFAFQDSDLDGVEDSRDRCPNTPILQLVDKYGCPLESKRGVRGKFYLRVGGGVLKDGSEERTFSLFSVAYSYKRFYTSFTTRYYLSSKLYDPGMGDSSLFLGYSGFVTDRLYILPGVRIKLPTGDSQYSDGKVDYTPSLVLDYILDGYDVFAYLSYTFRGDSALRDTFSYSVGAGYDFTRSLYVSLSYDLSQSAVRSGYNSYLSVFTLYDLTDGLYTTLSYSKGINEEATDHSLSVRLGIRF
ncbi:transporter [Hydrogenivirga sp.]